MIAKARTIRTGRYWSCLSRPKQTHFAKLPYEYRSPGSIHHALEGRETDARNELRARLEIEEAMARVGRSKLVWSRFVWRMHRYCRAAKSIRRKKGQIELDNAASREQSGEKESIMRQAGTAWSG